MTSFESVTEPIPLAAAARTLGISREAVRQRIRRGSLTAHKVDDRWYVSTDPGAAMGSVIGAANVTTTSLEQYGDQHELIAILRDEVAFLRQTIEQQVVDLRRKDEAIAALTERLLALALPTPQPHTTGDR